MDKLPKGMAYSDKFIQDSCHRLYEENLQLKARLHKAGLEIDTLRRQIHDCGKTLSEVLEGRVN